MITAWTRWEGTPSAMEGVVAGSKAAKPLHESMGAKNARLMRPLTGPGGFEVATYLIDFDDAEAFGRLQDQMLESDWVVQLRKDVAAAHPDLRMADQGLVYNAISD